ncbi:hypothetical protein HYPSUDRAFT_48484 [Hypholoma sublateritium FD-334 SS-4]|uniref:F-box domain-containing protein n=1 Tax=Hypholoma sublateritium (strain FD-334 SS-4) TaxID=945553 RepID=A0A0D2KL35_HYPSF|nr:hypothetical protein HYPSUDRAFT_48484 [Hypholoma sublateritium FD-334 SS-4]
MLDQESETPAIVFARLEYRHIPSRLELLPDDVLSEIFKACLDNSKSKNPTFDTRTAPMLLTRISCRIRFVAMHTPQLWVAVHMEFGRRVVVSRNFGGDVYPPLTKKMMLHARQQSAELRRWLLERSGALPLSISIYQRPRNRDQYSRDVADEVMDTLLACYPRWRDISLDFHSSDLSRIAALHDSDFPYLRSLRLQFNKPGDISLHSSPLLRARHLRELVLTHCDLSKANTSVAWANITSLKFSGSLWRSNTTNWISEILRRTTRLVHCDIEVPHCENGPPTGEICLPFVETLSINELASYRLLQPFILGRINAPALRRLVLRNAQCHPGHLAALLARSQNIKELYLARARPLRLKDELRNCPSLETLRIFALPLPKAYHVSLLEEFAGSSDRAPLCPNLVSFRCSSRMYISADVVRKLYGRSASGMVQRGWRDLTIRSFDHDAQQEIDRFSLEIPALEGEADEDDPDTW